MNTVRSDLARLGRSPVEFRAEIPETTGAVSAGPEQAVLRAELASEVDAALADLSPRLRAAIVLTSLQHMSVSEAAQVEGCTRATMYWRIHQARKLLKRRLGKYLSS
jgi:RNA polymerase sigma factor (sigma-70 family)